MKKIEISTNRINRNESGIRPIMDEREIIPVKITVETETDGTPVRETFSKKYNLKIGEQDLALLDEIANLQGTSRTSVIDDVVMQALTNQLLSIGALDMRAAVAIAANELAGDITGFDGDNGSDFGWIQIALKNELTEMARLCLEYNCPWEEHIEDFRSTGIEQLKQKLAEIIENV